MHEQIPLEQVAVPWPEIVGFMLSVSFGAWAWVVRKFGQQHVDSLKELAQELREMRRDVTDLKERVKVIEVLQVRSGDDE